MKFTMIAGAGLLLAGMFQMPSSSPVKLGLWESTTTMTMVMPGLPGGQRAPMVVKSRSCVTADTWAKAFTDSGRASGCTLTNQKYAGGHLTFDMVCPNVSGTGHGDMNFGDVVSHSTIHMDMKPGGHPATSDMVTESKFVSAACGAVTPGKAQILH